MNSYYLQAKCIRAFSAVRTERPRSQQQVDHFLVAGLCRLPVALTGGSVGLAGAGSTGAGGGGGIASFANLGNRSSRIAS